MYRKNIPVAHPTRPAHYIQNKGVLNHQLRKTKTPTSILFRIS